MTKMKKFLLWVLAVFITLFAAVFQRMTGPSYPARGEVTIDKEKITYRLPRTHVTTSDCLVFVKTGNPNLEGKLFYRRFKTGEPWTGRNMAYDPKTESLSAYLPSQPAAGKLEYTVLLSSREEQVKIGENDPVVIRFKDPVPGAILIPHVLIMFTAMLFSTRAGLEALYASGNIRPYVLWTFALLLVGGMILGPIVQKYAFGSFWTGFPFGTDLTDNKTLIGFLGWLAAFIAVIRKRPNRGLVLAASILLLAVYLIPHSLLGSELDYSRVPGSLPSQIP